MSDPERDAFIAKLEADLARKRVGVLPPVALLGVVCAAVLMAWLFDDAAYFVSSRTPLELGAEGAYTFERAQPNRYAQLHGVPSAKGWYIDEAQGAYVLVGVNDTPLAVRRRTFDEENRRVGDVRPQPRQNPFFVRGRLLSRAQASKYEEALRSYEAWSGGKVQWLLLAEETPGEDSGTAVLFSGAFVFALVNLWFFSLSLRKRGEGRGEGPR